MKNIFKKNIILIVSGYSSGRFLAPMFRGKGYHCIHITSTSEFNNPVLNKHYIRTDYLDNIVIDSENDYDNLLKKLEKYNVMLVIAGSEPGVLLADKLSEFFNTPRNTYSLSAARRDKYLMHEALKKNGVLCAKQIHTQHVNAALNFRDLIKADRIVVKPLSSSSSDNVFYCHSENEIRNSFEIILNKKNILDELNDNVLVQEYLNGKQYIVNTVSSEGNHFITDVWEEVSANDNIPSNDIHANMVKRNTEIYSVLANYTYEVLNSLGIRYGAAHSEIRITKNGPCLVEIGARLPGNVDFSIMDYIVGFSQVSLLHYALLHPALFKKISQHNPSHKKFVRLVYLFSNVGGPVIKIPDITFFMQYESVYSIGLNFTKNDYLYKTNRALRNPRPGYIYLVNDDIENLEDDYNKIRQSENDFYLSLV